MTVAPAGMRFPVGVDSGPHAGGPGTPGASNAAVPDGAVAMNPVQRRTFDQLLAVGGHRPVMPPGLPEDLEAKISAGTAGAISRWTEKRLFLAKSQMFTALRCEGQLQADSGGIRRGGLHPATVVGIVAHRAIQIAHTHPKYTVEQYVQFALDASMNDTDIAEFWNIAGPGTQSDLKMQAISKVASFLDSWPSLNPSWTPRFEEPLQARVGGVTLSVRADLTLGRPRPDGKQTMVLCDLKSGALRDEEHFDEAMLYALVSTLRNRVAPFRSTVFSLASGDYTDADVTAERLHTVADKVVEAVNRIVDIRTERRPATLVAGNYCGWCPAKTTCPAYAAFDGNVSSSPSTGVRVLSVTAPVPAPQADPSAPAGASASDIDPFDLSNLPKAG